MIRKLLAEFVGTGILCFVGVMAVTFSGSLTGVAVAFGFVVAGLIGALGHVSGAHLNPAVSIGLWSIRRLPGKELLGYLCAQILGGILAGLLICLMKESGGEAQIGGSVLLNGIPRLANDVLVWQGLLAEVTGTFILMLVILGAGFDKRATQPAGVWIGLSLTAIILALGPISGAGLNPARYLSPAVFALGDWSQSWLWIVGPVVGAMLAGFVGRQIFELESSEKINIGID